MPGEKKNSKKKVRQQQQLGPGKQRGRKRRSTS
jgi:hypothetical protein